MPTSRIFGRSKILRLYQVVLENQVFWSVIFLDVTEEAESYLLISLKIVALGGVSIEIWFVNHRNEF